MGRKTAKILATHIAWKKQNNPEASLLDTCMQLTVEELTSIADIGPVTAESIVDYFADTREMVQELFSEVHPELPDVSPRGGALEGKSFCVTGSFEQMSRDRIHDYIEANGGEVRTSVSPKLSYLVAGADAGSKLAKAQTLNISILSLEALLELSNGSFL